MDFDRMRRARQAQLAEDGEATAVPETTETRMRAAPTLVVDNPEPEEIGDPTPGAIGVLVFVALHVSLLLWVCRLCGADIGVVMILAPMWGSALALSLAGAVVTTIAWARRHDR